MLSEHPFYKKLNVIKTNHSFRGYINELQSRISWEKRSNWTVSSSKPSIKDLFSDLLNETKGFKYQITLKVKLKNRSQMEKLNLDQFTLIRQ